MTKLFMLEISLDEHKHFGRLVQDPASWAILASLTVQVWETIICFPEEVEYLWRGKFGAVKILYSCSRYLMLLGQVVNHVLSMDFFDYAPQDQTLCRKALVSQSVVVQLGVFLMEVVMILRVFALYNQSTRIKWLFFGVFTVSISLELHGSGNFIAMTTSPLGCSGQGLKNVGIYYFCAGAIFGQMVLVIAMLAGLILRHRTGKSRTPLVTMLLNQGLATFVLVLALVVSMLICNFFPDLVDGMHNGYAVLSWYSTLLSIGTCRILLQMWKLGTSEMGTSGPQGEDFERSSSVVLTSVVPDSQFPPVDIISPANAAIMSITRAQSK